MQAKGNSISIPIDCHTPQKPRRVPDSEMSTRSKSIHNSPGKLDQHRHKISKPSGFETDRYPSILVKHPTGYEEEASVTYCGEMPMHSQPTMAQNQVRAKKVVSMDVISKIAQQYGQKTNFNQLRQAAMQHNNQPSSQSIQMQEYPNMMPVFPDQSHLRCGPIHN